MASSELDIAPVQDELESRLWLVLNLGMRIEGRREIVAEFETGVR